MNRELYCLYYGEYVKELPEYETDECMDYPHACDLQDCEFCEEHLFDNSGNRVD